MPSGGLLVQQVAELVEAMKRGALCARTLQTVVLSEDILHFGGGIEPLQAALSQASVTLG